MKPFPAFDTSLQYIQCFYKNSNILKMRKNFILLGILIVISMSSCEKEAEDKIHTDFSFYAIKNGSEWISTNSWAYYTLNEKKMVIVGSKPGSLDYEVEQLHFIFKTSDITKNTVTNFYSAWNLIIDGDAIADTYIIDTTYNNSLKIDLFDTVAKRIRGTFDVKLIREERRSDLRETMLFKDGAFNLKYEDYVIE